MDVLRLRFRPDDEWLGELTASVSAEGFSAVGTAWFSKDDLRKFAESLSAFPLPEEVPPSISGGLGANETNPPQEVVAIRFEPHDARGMVRATVRLATEIWNGKERDLSKEATIRFIVTYGDLARFGPAMRDLIEGLAAEAVLTSTP
ncbi:hypothetical protein [Flavisphingomonas formosensis]|uniref:hypothetical protein n=1 Tax=Flavisphingomonas formosensis TaxID=861534 RepID=UPI0012F91C9E|nr:hypothetical protein [Sphingomonas formosensis]